MGGQLALRTYRLSATGGTRDIGSMIASSTGGAGSSIRMYKFIVDKNKFSPTDYFFNYLDGNRKYKNDFNTFYTNFNK